MDVFVANEQEIQVDEAHLSNLAKHVLEAEDVDDGAELSVLLVGRDHIKRLNARFAGDDYATPHSAGIAGTDIAGEPLVL